MSRNKEIKFAKWWEKNIKEAYNSLECFLKKK
ncbi:hypothetical protein PSAG_04760 [Fusobacterium animalis D11]|uniref:Uncharacterized protein n=1 Tax=Fusobacterium animalis D11 TaxID=556264 RepID=A0A0K9CMZ8_9FUSO|nr:hypothetical protein PSAG_04760 [Fusobacterium animalis D11]